MTFTVKVCSPGPTGTLEAAAAPRTSGPGYTRLTAGPGWPLVVRGDLAAPKSGRDDRRRAIADVVIDTAGSLEETLTQADALWERLTATR